jgi:hypothetical protein
MPTPTSRPHLELQRIGAENKCPAKVRLPLLEDGAQIEEEDVVFTDSEVGRIFSVGKKSVLASANDSLVPVGRDSIHLLGKSVDIGVEAALGDAGANQPTSFHFMK